MKLRTLFRAVFAPIAIFAVMALPCFASEVAVLKNGFTIQHERREIVGEITRLYVNKDGASFVDVPTTEIDHFEAGPEVPATSSLPPFAKNAKDGAPTFRFGKSKRAHAKAGLPAKRPTTPTLGCEVLVPPASCRLPPTCVMYVTAFGVGFGAEWG
jgi:hypothetical protein